MSRPEAEPLPQRPMDRRKLVSTMDHPGLMECTRQELQEMLAVCVGVGGDPSRIYTAEALKVWDMFQ